LLALLHRVPATDTHLLYVVRKAIRDQLNADGVLTRLQTEKLSEADESAIAEVAVGVASAEAGEFLLRHVQQYSRDKETLANYLRHSARYAPEKEMDTLASFARNKFADDVDLQLALFKSVQQGTEQRGASLRSSVRNWGEALATQLLRSVDDNSLTWNNTPPEGATKITNPWLVQQRPSSDGDKGSLFLCSLPPGGEDLTGILRSKPFTVPAKLSFYLAGHDGFPDRPAKKKNVVRLRSAGAGEVLAETFAPRNDLAQPIAWDLSAHAGKKGFLEIVDGDDGTAYAWLAVGRFNPPVVNVPTTNPNVVGQRQQAAAELARSLPIPALEPQLARILLNPSTELDACASVARALVALRPNETLAALAPLVGDPAVPTVLRQQISEAIVGKKSTDAQAVLLEAIRTSPRRGQIKLAQALVSSASGAEELLKLVADRQAPANLLLERSVKDKLLATKQAGVGERIVQLTQGLSPASEQIQRLLDRRRAAYDPNKANPVRGDQVFTQNCRICHQLDGIGNVVGPQLDGIGNRGLERIVEDVLDPNRNVDRAFRNTLLVLNDDDVVSGLFRREEGEMVVLAESTGKEISVPKNQIKERRETDTSLMPENFGDIIPPEDFNHLIAYLLSKGSRPTEQR
jgi:putative heme-binding domain-containing protein